MTHKQLVEIAYRWILKNGGMTIAFKELYSLANEIPDVIGFNSWESAVIECKASRADFLCDKKKPHRIKGMGNWRFYCCPIGMIKKSELPEKWGLIYVNGLGKAKVEHDCRKKKVNEGWPQEWMKKDYPNGFERWVTADENKFDSDTFEERKVMFTVIRRLFIKGFVKHIYDKQYNRNMTANDLILFNSEQNDAVSDTTGDDSNSIAGKKSNQ